MFSTDLEYTFFHTRTWLDTLLRVFNHWRDASQHMELPDGRQVWLPMLETDQIGPWRWVESMPYAFLGGPLVSEGELSRDNFADLIGQIIRPGGIGFLNLNLDPISPLAKLEKIPPKAAIPLTTHLLELAPDFEAVQRGFTKTMRYDMRRAERAGVSARRGQGVDDFLAYFELMRLAAQRWGLAGPPFPRPLYTALAALPEDRIRLWLASFQDQIIGGLISLHYAPGRALYWSSALNPAYAHLSPTKLLQREDIRLACEHGVTQYNMGPSAGFDGAPLDGVRQSKEALGARPYDYAVAIWMNPWAMRARAVRDRARQALKPIFKQIE